MCTDFSILNHSSMLAVSISLVPFLTDVSCTAGVSWVDVRGPIAISLSADVQFRPQQGGTNFSI